MHIFLPHCVQLLFLIVPHRAHLVTFYLKIGIPHFAEAIFLIFFFGATLRVHFNLPHRVHLLF